MKNQKDLVEYKNNGKNLPKLKKGEKYMELEIYTEFEEKLINNNLKFLIDYFRLVGIENSKYLKVYLDEFWENYSFFEIYKGCKTFKDCNPTVKKKEELTEILSNITVETKTQKEEKEIIKKKLEESIEKERDRIEYIKNNTDELNKKKKKNKQLKMDDRMIEENFSKEKKDTEEYKKHLAQGQKRGGKKRCVVLVKNKKVERAYYTDDHYVSFEDVNGNWRQK